MTSAVGTVQPRAVALSGVEEVGVAALVEVVLAGEVLVVSGSAGADEVDADELPPSAGEALSVESGEMLTVAVLSPLAVDDEG